MSVDRAKIAELSQLVKRFGERRLEHPGQAAEAMQVLAACVALAAEVPRDEFMRDAGVAYDRAKREASGGASLIVAPDGKPYI